MSAIRAPRMRNVGTSCKKFSCRCKGWHVQHPVHGGTCRRCPVTSSCAKNPLASVTPESPSLPTLFKEKITRSPRSDILVFVSCKVSESFDRRHYAGNLYLDVRYILRPVHRPVRALSAERTRWESEEGFLHCSGITYARRFEMKQRKAYGAMRAE